jgi:hypothetical protein
MISEEQLFLFPKRNIEDSLRFRIPTGLTRKSMFGDGLCSWEELLKTEGPLPTDIVTGISWDEEEYESDSGVSFVVVVNRTREETDEEYLRRLQQNEEMKKHYEEREFRDYQRLKAKYEQPEDYETGVL